jgi:hypothetical protein
MTLATPGPSVQDVDAAVRSVLSDMSRVDRVRPSGPSATGGEDVFDGRLLSLRQVEALRPGVREIRVAPETVVTPLARDSLKRLGIGLRLIARAEAERVRDLGEWGFSIESASGVVGAFRRSLLDGEGGWIDLGLSGVDSARWVAGARGRGALVLTAEASVAVYVACQIEGVRASAAEEVGSVARAVRALGVNLLVVEPAGKPIALLRQIAATFRRAGGPMAPDWVGSRRGGLV